MKHINIKMLSDDSRSFGTIHISLVALVLIAAALIRVIGACNDLWLDEVWSLKLINTISSPLEVFTNIHHDNNHYLNSLFMYLFAPIDSPLLYRTPAILAGIGSVSVAGLIGKRYSRANAFIAMLLMTFSYMMVLYSSEARGYACVVFFSLLSFFLLLEYMEKHTLALALLFSLSMVLGFASHLTFVNFFASAGIWSCYTLAKSGTGFRRTLVSLLSCYTLPIIFLILIYLIDISHFALGVALTEETPSYLFAGFDNAVKWAIGIPFSGYFGYAAILQVLMLLATGLYSLQREKAGQWLFFPLVILLVPNLLSLLRQPCILYPRYFLIPIAFLLLLVSRGLAFLCCQGRWGKVFTIILICFYVVANGEYVIELMKYGRGQYSETVHFLKEKSIGNRVVISGERDDYGIPLLLQYHSRKYWSEKLNDIYWIHSGSWTDNKSESNALIRLSEIEFYGGDKFGYDSSYQIPKNLESKWGPEWLILWRVPTFKQAPPPGILFDKIGNRYDLVQSFPTAHLSGYNWYIFHKLNHYCPVNN